MLSKEELKPKTIIFKDYPEFRPNLTPRQIFGLGSFGGTYWRPIYSGITKKHYKDEHKEFPQKWWAGIPEEYLSSSNCNLDINFYKVNSGTSQEFWEEKGWIKEEDAYGWVEWYCRFYAGRRSPDDERQIKRWLAFAGPNGRFRKYLINKINKEHAKYNDFNISPVVREGLEHWAYQLTKKDFDNVVK